MKPKSKQITATFTLKCPLCGNVEKRNAEDCKGDDPPACSKCFAPMFLKSVSAG